MVTVTYWAEWRDAQGNLITGLTPVITIYEQGNPVPIIEGAEMTMFNEALDGVFYYEFTSFDPSKKYYAMCIGKRTLLLSNNPQLTWNNIKVPDMIHNHILAKIDQIGSGGGNLQPIIMSYIPEFRVIDIRVFHNLEVVGIPVFFTNLQGGYRITSDDITTPGYYFVVRYRSGEFDIMDWGELTVSGNSVYFLLNVTLDYYLPGDFILINLYDTEITINGVVYYPQSQTYPISVIGSEISIVGDVLDGSTETEIMVNFSGNIPLVDDLYNNMQVVIIKSDLKQVSRNIKDFSSDGVIVVDPLPFVPGVGDHVVIISKVGGMVGDVEVDVDVDSIVNGVWNANISNHNIPNTFGSKNQRLVPSENINDYKTDISSLALESTTQAIKAKTDNLPSNPASESQATINKEEIISEINENELKIDIIDQIVDNIKLSTDRIPSDPTSEAVATTNKDAIINKVNATELKVDILDANIDLITSKLPDNNIMGSSVKSDQDDEIRDIIELIENLDTNFSNIQNQISNETNEIDSKLIDIEDNVVNVELKVDNIKAKTDNLPSDPTSETLATANKNAIIDKITVNDSKIDIIDENVDQIKLKTDNLPDNTIIELQNIINSLSVLDNNLDSVLEDTGTTIPTQIDSESRKIDSKLVDIGSKIGTPPTNLFSDLKSEIDNNEMKIDVIDNIVNLIKLKTDNLPSDPVTNERINEIETKIDAIQEDIGDPSSNPVYKSLNDMINIMVSGANIGVGAIKVYGIVKSRIDSTPQKNIRVRAYHKDTRQVLVETFTNADGKWYLYLDPGSYYFEFGGEPDNKDGFVKRIILAGVATSPPEQSFQTISLEPTIIGQGSGSKTVGWNGSTWTYGTLPTTALGKPISGVRVRAWLKNVEQNTANLLAQDYSDKNGRYTLFLNPGDYVLKYSRVDLKETSIFITVD